MLIIISTTAGSSLLPPTHSSLFVDRCQLVLYNIYLNRQRRGLQDCFTSEAAGARQRGMPGEIRKDVVDKDMNDLPLKPTSVMDSIVNGWK